MTEVDESLMPEGQETEVLPSLTQETKAWVEFEFDNPDEDVKNNNCRYSIFVQHPTSGEISLPERYGPFPYIDDSEMDERLINITNQIFWSFEETKTR